MLCIVSCCAEFCCFMMCCIVLYCMWYLHCIMQYCFASFMTCYFFHFPGLVAAIPKEMFDFLMQVQIKLTKVIKSVGRIEHSSYLFIINKLRIHYLYLLLIFYYYLLLNLKYFHAYTMFHILLPQQEIVCSGIKRIRFFMPNEANLYI